jgi:hypothetical protein
MSKSGSFNQWEAANFEAKSRVRLRCGGIDDHCNGRTSAQVRTGEADSTKGRIG